MKLRDELYTSHAYETEHKTNFNRRFEAQFMSDLISMHLWNDYILGWFTGQDVIKEYLIILTESAVVFFMKHC